MCGLRTIDPVSTRTTLLKVMGHPDDEKSSRQNPPDFKYYATDSTYCREGRVPFSIERLNTWNGCFCHDKRWIFTVLIPSVGLLVNRVV